MPSISEFYGIKIYMYWNDNRQHKMPHFHAYYAGKNAVFDLKGSLLDGNLPLRARQLIKEWALENQKEITYAWKCVEDNKTPHKIKGLK